jgi:heme exporter protein D
MSPTPHAGAAPEALRAEHDDLARRLEIRRSVDVARRGLYQLFFGLLSVGLSLKLAWDRWGVLKPGMVRKIPKGPPLFLWIAIAVAAVLLVLAVRSLVATRRLQREEDALFARYRTLREALGLDP